MSFAQNPIQKFVLLATPRTGSTLAVEILNQHPEIKCYSEMFVAPARGIRKGHNFVAGPTDLLIFNESEEKQLYPHDQAVVEYLERLYASYSESEKAIGLKIMYHDMQVHKAVSSYLLNIKPKVIHLWRKNFLHILVSRQYAERSHILHNTGKSEIEFGPISLNTDNLVETLIALRDNHKHTCHRLATQNFERFDLAYEELVVDKSVLQSIFEFLGVSKFTPTSETNLKRLRTKDIKDSLANYDQVRSILQGTEFFDLLI